jgi:predicted dehydrogenase
MDKKNSPTEISLGINRRRFIYYSAIAAAGATILPGCVGPRPNYKSPNEKLNIGAIGVGGKGATDIEGCATENIVALADVDTNTLAKAGQKYPGARQYQDYREMLEKQKDLDAVIISTPDHHHYFASMLALEYRKHLYVQKPLTHSVWEARQLTKAARAAKVATQMGNQGHSMEGNRELCEMIWAGTIGDIREVHCWSDRPIWPQGHQRLPGKDPVPTNINWDLWLGPAPMRPYKSNWPDNVDPQWKRAGRPVYHPFSWRGFWDFGCGALGDMGCHVLDGANWALKLGAPTSVEVLETSGITPDMAPRWAVIRYQFPSRDGLPPVTLTWHDGGRKPEKPAEMEGKELQSNGSLFIGSKGKLFCETYGSNPTLFPESKMKDFVKPPKTIPRTPNNSPYDDWIRACKGGPATCSNFNVAGPFTETVLLGNLALRSGKKVEWDSKNLRATNIDVSHFVRREPRKGWEI